MIWRLADVTEHIPEEMTVLNWQNRSRGGISAEIRTRGIPMPITPHEILQLYFIGVLSCLLSHDQDTFHALKRCVEMRNFRMAALTFLTGYGLKQEPMPMGKSHISQLGVSSELEKHLACGLMHPRP